MQNYLTMYSEFIQLNGFEHLSDKATFCFYDKGVVITPRRQINRSYYYHVDITKERKIIDSNLIEKLKVERGYVDKVNYFFTGDSYIELVPQGLSNNQTK